MKPLAAQQAKNYLRTRVMTATPEQLQLMLYDGAIRFAEQGRSALEKKDFNASYTALTRAQRIVVELTGSLRHSTAPELCAKLSSLYNYVHRKLVDANVGRTTDPIDAALKILRYQRETWLLLMEQLGKQRAGAAASNIDIPAPEARMEASISMRG